MNSLTTYGWSPWTSASSTRAVQKGSTFCAALTSRVKRARAAGSLAICACSS